LPVTLPNADVFSKFFYRKIQQEFLLKLTPEKQASAQLLETQILHLLTRFPAEKTAFCRIDDIAHSQ